MIAGIVVIYNPDEKVQKNLSSYFNFIDYLYIVDNSEKINENLKRICSIKGNTEYIFSHKNLGMAAALNIGVEKAINAGHSFLLTMDQDSYFEGDSLNKLISKINDDDRIGIYSPFHKNRFLTSLPSNQGIEEVSDVMTSGNILNLSAAKKVGSFKDSYFIDYVDIEYCLRLRKNGFKILRVNDSFLIHNEANLSKRKFLGTTVYPQNHSPIRWYYKIRNYLYLKNEYYDFFKGYFDVEKKIVRNNIIKVILFEKDKIKKINMILKGYIHFRKNITGKLPS